VWGGYDYISAPYPFGPSYPRSLKVFHAPNLQGGDMSIIVEKMPQIEKGNPFLSDFYNMGSCLGTNVMAMYSNHPNEVAKYIIIVNMETGERVKIKFSNVKFNDLSNSGVL
jgi:hypothetical protein